MVLDFPDLLKKNSKIIILSGGRGTGKTVNCQRWVDQAAKSNWRASGLICPAIIEKGVKTGIAVKDLSTGETRKLAIQVDDSGGEVVTDHWKFDPVVLQWGSEVISNINLCDLLVVDELGPLEFYRQQGWVEAFDVIKAGQYRMAVIVIRPELLDEAKVLWPEAVVIMTE